MRREEVCGNGFRKVLAMLLVLGMLFAGLPAWAAEEIISSPVYNPVELPAGDDLSVAATGLISVDGEDIEIVNANPGNDSYLDNVLVAVRGDGAVSDFVADSVVTIEAGGSILATVVYNAAETDALSSESELNGAGSSNTYVYVRGIDADEGSLAINNAGAIDAAIEVDGSTTYAHAMGIQVHNDNTSNLEHLTLVTNTGDIFATAVNYNSASRGEATARGIQVGGTDPNGVPADFGNLTIDNSGTVAASAAGYEASSRAIKMGGAGDTVGTADFYDTTILNDGTLSATTTAGDSGSAWVVQSGGYLDGLTVTNTGAMLADVTASATATDDYDNNYADANARVIKVGEQMMDLSITNDGTMLADAFTVGDETASSISANSRGIHIGRDNDTVSFLNNGTMTVNAGVFAEDGLSDYLFYDAEANASAFHMGYNSASVSITNANLIEVDASATANTDNGVVSAGASGVHTGGQGLSEANEDFTFDNSGELNVTASATADEKAYRGASASASGVHLGTVLDGSINNQSMVVNSSAVGENVDYYHSGDGEGETPNTAVSSSARGIHVGYDSANVSITTDSMTVAASAEGTDTSASNYGHVNASARGVQVGYNSAGLDLVNTTAMTVSAAADGENVDSASANARAIQIGGEYADDIMVDNQGLIDVAATAHANDATDLSANARGIKIGEDTVNEVTGVEIFNHGEMQVLAQISGGDIDYDGEANAKGIHLGDDFADVTIENNLLSVAAEAVQDSGNAHAWGIQTGYNVTTLGIDNTGSIQVDATATEEANATGVKLGKDNQGTITNAGTIAATATSLTDYEAHARGIHIGENSAGGMVDITNEAGATISAIATSTFNETAGAYGIQAGEDIIGLITNNGTIEAMASGGDYSTKALGVQAEGTMALDNFGNILVDLQVEDSDDIEGSRAYGVSAPDGYEGREASILNAAGATIQVNADYNLGYTLDGNSGAFGIRVAEYGIHLIENAGDIIATSSIFAGDDINGNLGAFGIRTSSTYYDSDLNDITNSGSITASSTIESLTFIEDNAGAFGIRSGSTDGGNTSIVNEAGGTITAASSLTAPEMYESLGAFGIRMGNDYAYEGGSVYNAAVMNYGDISVDASIDTDYVNGGENYNRGAFGIRTGTAEVVNNGSITAAATMDGMNDSAYDGAYGIRTGHGDATVINTGSIDVSLVDNDSSTMQRAVGIMTGQTGNEIHQSGNITATAAGGDAYSVAMGCDEGGTIVPAIAPMPAPPNALLVLDGAEMVGDALNASPSDAAFVAFGLDSVDGMADFGPEYADATEYILAIEEAASGDLGAFQTAIYNGVTVDPDFSFTFNDDFVGEQGWKAALVGGSTILNNSDASTIEDMVVGSEALLGGNAHVGNLTAFGDLSPGNSLGTINVSGDFYQGEDSTYYLEVGSNETSDLIAVTGDAYVEDAAQVDVATVGYVADGDLFTILTAEGNLESVYNAANLNYQSLILDYALDYTIYNTVRLSAARTPYEDVGVSSSGAGVGAALIGDAENGSEEAATLLGMIDSMMDAGEMDEVLNALAPEQYPNLLDMSMAGGALYRSALAGRMGNLHVAGNYRSQQYVEVTNSLTPSGPALSRLPAYDRRQGGLSSWVRVLGMSGTQDRDSSNAGYEFDTYGISLGFDNKVNNNLAMGVGLGYADSDVDFDNYSQGSDLESYYGSLYGTYSMERFYLDGAISYASNDYDSTRRIQMPAATATSSTDGSELGVFLGGGYSMVDTETMYFIPTASVSWAQVDIDGFTEQGAGAFNLDVDDYDADSLITTLGFRFGGRMGIMEPELRLAWAHEFGDTERDVTANFASGTTTFVIDGVEPDEDSALVGVGTNIFLGDNFTVYLDYDGEFRSDFDAHSISGGLRYNF